MNLESSRPIGRDFSLLSPGDIVYYWKNVIANAEVNPVSYPSLQPDRREILRYLGCQSPSPSPEMEKAVDWGMAQIAPVLQPRTLWRPFPLSGTHAEGTELTLEGQDITRHLAGCTQVILMAVTMGTAVERLLMRWEAQDMGKAMVLDACASAAVEAECDRLEEELRQRYQAQGLYLTSRFSPGYGDLPLAQQAVFCRVLDTQRRIGLTLTPTGLMVPRKSVTAVLGLSPVPRGSIVRGCNHCSMAERCAIRKGGHSCEHPQSI